MTEQETREKIFNIIREFNVKKRRYSTHTEPSDDDELADALVAAGIGDVWNITEKAENAIVSLIEQNKNYRHRAEVVEKQIYCLARMFAEALCKNGNPENLIQGFIKDAQKQAEQELAEEGER